MNKKVLSFLIPFLMLGFIATLFPPTYGYSTFNGFSFLFSSSFHSIIWGKLILEYIFISFLSGLIAIIYWKLGSIFISYFSISLILSIIFYFLFGFASYIFYPSYNPIVTKEKSIKIQYDYLLRKSRKGPYLLGGQLYNTLDSTFSYRYYSDRAFNSYPIIVLPDTLFPLAQEYLYPVNEDSIDALEHSTSLSTITFRRPVLKKLTVASLPHHYKDFVIPYGFSLDDKSLISDVDSISYSYFSNLLEPLFNFYILKRDYLEAEKKYLALTSLLQKVVSIIFFIVVMVVYFIKKNYLLKRFSR